MISVTSKQKHEHTLAETGIGDSSSSCYRGAWEETFQTD